MKALISLFSVVFHPLFIGLYTAIYYVRYIDINLPLDYKIQLISTISIYTVLLPLFVFLILKYFNYVKSIMVASTKERVFPLIVNSLILIQLISTMNYYTTPKLYVFFTGSLIATILSIYYSSIKIKLSLHMMGITVFCIFLLLYDDNLLWQTFSIIAVGIVASSRLVLNAHTYNELILGTVVAASTQLLSYYLFYNI